MPTLQHIPTITKAVQAIIAHDLTLPHAMILFACAEDAPTMTDLSKLLRCSTAAVTGQVDRMQDRGLISRDFDKDDRRSVRASITEKGRAKLSFLNATFETF